MAEKADRTEKRYQGVGVSPGISHAQIIIALGKFEEPEPYTIEAEEIEGEINRLEEGLVATRKQILEMQQQITESGAAREAGIFDAHILVLEDRSVLDQILRITREQRLNVDYVFYETMKRYMESLRRIDDTYLRERVIDIQDVAQRVVENLNTGGQSNPDHQALLDHHVVVAPDLTPSDTATMDRNAVLAFATEVGSYTSHTAIMARSLSIPAVVGLTGICASLHSGDEVLIDGYNGILIHNPSDATLKAYSVIEEEKAAMNLRLGELRDTDCITKDDRPIILSANIEFEYELTAVRENGARGIGLYRTEFFYFNETRLPDEEQQTRNYRRVAKAVDPDGVIIRTFDLGGDKLAGEPHDVPEPNPFLGWRGIRVSLDRTGVFKTQIRAVLKASADAKVRLMYPMISGVGELRRAKDLLEECKEELRGEGESFDENIETGAMIEVPSAAVMADLLAPEVDFFSIGTNDLVQYTIAVDRVNQRVASLYQPLHPAVIRLMKMTVDAGHRNDIWVGLCGEIGAELHLTPVLVGLGVDELSVAAVQLPRIKHAVQQLNFSDCQALVEEALQKDTAEEIGQLCQELAMQSYGELLT